jgi:uroporphyrinogen decarboxylase
MTWRLAMNGASEQITRSTAEREAVVGRFERRVEEGLTAAPPTKDWVRKALRRRGASRCPVRIKRLSLDIVLQYGDALADLFRQYPDDVLTLTPYEMSIGHQPPGDEPRINPLEVLIEEAEWTDEWGTRWGHALDGCGATPVAHPIGDWAQLDEYLATRMPKAREPGRLGSVEPNLRRLGAQKYVIGVIHLALFERLHALRGMGPLFEDLCRHEAEVRRLLDALTAYLVELVQMWAELGADAVFLTDDWGSQTSLMISPGMWRSYFKPHYALVFREAHRHDMEVIFHSCGNVTAIVDDLIDAGIDVLDPIQPGAMDVEEVARRFGGRVSFSATVDVQQLLTRGTPEQVDRNVRRMIDTLGRPFGCGLLIGPANVLTPDIPFENLVALFHATHEAAGQ